MEPECSLPSTQNLSVSLSLSKSIQSTAHQSYLFRTHFNIILNSLLPPPEFVYFLRHFVFLQFCVLFHTQIYSFLAQPYIYRGADKSLARPDWKKRLKVRHFSSEAEVIAVAETWFDGQPSEFFYFLSGLQKLEFGRCSLFPSWSG